MGYATNIEEIIAWAVRKPVSLVLVGRNRNPQKANSLSEMQTVLQSFLRDKGTMQSLVCVRLQGERQVEVKLFSLLVAVQNALASNI